MRPPSASLLHFFSRAAPHETPLSPLLLSKSAREAGHEPIISFIAERLINVIAEKDRFSSFLNDSKRQLQELKMEVVNVKVDKKGLIGTLKAREEETRI